MKRNLLIIAPISVVLLLAGPAMAVKRVSKSDNSAQQQNQATDSGTHVTPAPAAPSPGSSDKHLDANTDKRDGSQNNDSNRQPVQKPPEQPSMGQRDRFIDRDGDGLNDQMKKPPETVKKKKDSKEEESKDSHRSK
jgi:hypothetical protein